MYKLLLFLKKSGDPDFLNHFKNFTLPALKELSGKNVTAAKVESNLMIEQKYNWCCEVTAESKQEWDRLMATKAGIEINKDLGDFNSNIDLLFVNYDEEL
jgi:hypothetical protein